MSSLTRAAVVTGAAGGIGAATCSRLRAAGFWVVGTDRLPPGEGDCDAFVHLDLENVGQSDEAAARAAEQLRRSTGERPIHALVHAAAVQKVGTVNALTVEDFASTLRVNVLAPYALTRALAPELRAAQGAVVLITSIHARLSKRGFALYSTSKAAMSGLMRALALDLAPDVRVNAVSPAATDTPMLREGFGDAWNQATERRLAAVHPAQRIAQPAEIAAAVAFLLSPQASAITAAELEVGGGIHACLHDPS